MYLVRSGFQLFVVFSFAIGLCYGYDVDSEKNLAIAVVDFSRDGGPEVTKFVKITPESFKKAAIAGLLNHNWNITKITDDEVSGVLKEDYKARIVLAKRSRQNTIVKIYISGPSLRQNWADNIHRQMVAALVLLSN